MAFTKIGDQGWLKAAFYGGAGTGKTYTGTLLLAAAHKMFGGGRFAMYDTELGGPYIKGMVKELMGQDLEGANARSFDSLMQFMKDCQEAGVKYALIDSVSHVWTSLCDDYLNDLNSRGKHRQRLEFSDWGILKRRWNQFTTLYLNAPMHVVLCGREAAIWEWQEDDETHKKELHQIGTRLKSEKELAYEPACLVSMVREITAEKKGPNLRVGICMKDRFGVLDGLRMEFPVSRSAKKCLEQVEKAFGPHLQMLKGGGTPTVDTKPSDFSDVSDEGTDEFYRRKQERDILVEELSGLLDAKVGRTKARQELMQKFFGTFSKTKIESMRVEDLRSNLQDLRDYFDANDVPPPADEPGGDK